MLTAGEGDEVVHGVEAAATDPDARPLLAARIGALVRARYPGARELVAAAVAEEDLDPATRCEVLVAWRRAVQPPLGDVERAALPTELLRALD
jgi:hypothetical protein